MTTFSFPVNIRQHEPASGAPVDQVQARVMSQYNVVVSAAETGLAAGTTTIPLFVAPAGATFYACELDVVTAFDNTAGVNIAVGIPTSTGILYAATTVNTTGRRAYAATAAQLSANAIPLAADTTVQAIVSITTSAVTVGEVIVRVIVV